MTSYEILRDWFVEVIFIRGTRFMFEYNDADLVFSISDKQKIFEITIRIHDDLNSKYTSYEINDILSNKRVYVTESYEAKILIIKLIIDNGIPFIIDPLGINIKRR
jgi:hypothetical protein